MVQMWKGIQWKKFSYPPFPRKWTTYKKILLPPTYHLICDIFLVLLSERKKREFVLKEGERREKNEKLFFLLRKKSMVFLRRVS